MEMSAFVGLNCSRNNYVRLVVDLGDLEGRKSRNRGLAGKGHCRRGSPREGERRASGGHCEEMLY